MAEQELLGSVGNAARVLKAFTARRQTYGVSELARKLDLSKSTAHRLLTTLAAEQLVEQDIETGRYRLGLAVYDLLAATTAGGGLTEAVLPPMTVLRTRTGATVHVAVLDRREVVYVERLDSPQSLRMFLDVGRRNWAHSTATGKVLLAHLPPDDLDRVIDGWQLAALTPHTITDRERLRKELLGVLDTGYAHNLQESDIGAVSVAAPIRDASNTVVAAMSVVGPTSQISPELQRITHAAMEAAAVASRRLGHRARGSRS